MTQQQRQLWRGTAYLGFLTLITSVFLFFLLGLVLDVSPEFWNPAAPDIPQDDPPLAKDLPGFFVLLTLLYVLPQVLILFVQRLVYVCITPPDWIIFSELFMLFWVIGLITMLFSLGSLFVGLFYPQDQEGFRYLLHFNTYSYPMSQLCAGVLWLLNGLSGWRGQRIPRSLAGVALLGGAGIMVLSPFLANYESVVFETQAQNMFQIVGGVLFSAYFYLASAPQVDPPEAPTTVMPR